MKKYLLEVDLEGAHGVVGEPYKGLIPGCEEYEKAALNMAKEVDAAVKALFDSGADEVIVWDNHANLDNIDFSKVDSRAKKIKPESNNYGRLEFLKNGGFTSIMFLGYHSAEGSINGVLAHTYSSVDIQYYKINGKTIGEYDFDGILAQSFGIPIAFLSSDDVCVNAFKSNFPNAYTVITKIGKGRNSAEFIDENAVLSQIYANVSLAAKGNFTCNEHLFPCNIEVRFTRTEKAAEKLSMLFEQGIHASYGEDAHIIVGDVSNADELRKYL